MKKNAIQRLRKLAADVPDMDRDMIAIEDTLTGRALASPDNHPICVTFHMTPAAILRMGEMMRRGREELQADQVVLARRHRPDPERELEPGAGPANPRDPLDLVSPIRLAGAVISTLCIIGVISVALAVALSGLR